MALTSDNIASIVGFALFLVSELLPFINIQANGIFQTVVVGFQNAFNQNTVPHTKDIELAQNLVTTQDNFANIVNTVNSNPYVKDIITNLIKNPSVTKNIQAIQNNPELSHLISTLTYYNTDISTLIKTITTAPEPNAVATESD